MWPHWVIREIRREFWWGKTEGNTLLRIYRPGWEDNDKMDLKLMGRDCGDWI
jgi:hypothetical protein